MKHTLIYPIGITQSCTYASENLKQMGFSIIDHPAPEVTHLLLDIPSFRSDGCLRSGDDLSKQLSMLPKNVTVVGGNLDLPVLSQFSKQDFLKDPDYLARNAAITADCAFKTAAPLMKTTFADTPTLILGWGRIGKCLAQLLKSLGSPVTVAARKDSDRALLCALGYESLSFNALPDHLPRFRLLLNTVPAPVLSEQQLACCQNCVKIELASRNGLDGEDIIIARGLPGQLAPASSGHLIADTFYRLWKEGSR